MSACCQTCCANYDIEECSKCQDPLCYNCRLLDANGEWMCKVCFHAESVNTFLPPDYKARLEQIMADEKK